MASNDDQCMKNLIPAMLGLIGLILSLTGGCWCTLGTLPVNESFTINNSTPTWLSAVSDVQFGLFGLQEVVIEGYSTDPDTLTLTIYTNTLCVDYPSGVSRDGSWSAAYGLQITTFVLTGIATMVLLASLCCLPLPGKAMSMMGVVFILAGVLFQGLVFLFYQSNLCVDNPIPQLGYLQDLGVYQKDCKLGSAGIILIVAIVFFFLTGIACCYVAKSAKNGGEGEAAPAEGKEVDQEAVPAEGKEGGQQDETAGEGDMESPEDAPAKE